MDILQNYKKKSKEPLKSATVKLRQEQVDALREYNINLGLLVRTMLDDSDLMQTYRKKHNTDDKATVTQKPSSLAEQAFNESKFRFTHDNIDFHYLNSDTMFEKSSDGKVTQIKKGRFYGVKKKHDKEAGNV